MSPVRLRPGVASGLGPRLRVRFRRDRRTAWFHLAAWVALLAIAAPLVSGLTHDSETVLLFPDGAPTPPAVTAGAAALIDVGSGRLLYAKNGSTPRAPASLTKVMTGLLCLEAGNLDEPVTISPQAAGTEGSSVWLEAGEVHTLRDLLHALLLRSGNDAAVAIAEHLGGSVEEFAFLMNQRAGVAGASETHFRNPHGLPASGHETTAVDLAYISREALLRADFREVVSTRHYVMPWPGQPWDRALYNENRLLWLYPGADGVKTGWTSEAGRCFIGSATRDGWQLAAVVLDAPEMWADTTALLDWGFTSFRPVLLYPQGAEVSRTRVAGVAERWVQLSAGRDIRVPLLPGEETGLLAVPDVPRCIGAPVVEGVPVGNLEVWLRGSPAGRFPLVATTAIPGGGVLGRFMQDLWLLLVRTLERMLT